MSRQACWWQATRPPCPVTGNPFDGDLFDGSRSGATGQGSPTLALPTFTDPWVYSYRLARVAEELIGNEEELRALDAELGDGDLGITVREGFRVVRTALAARPSGEPAGATLLRCGAAFSEANPSTMATLLGKALMRAGRALGAKELLTLPDLAAMGRAAAEGIVQRGKAHLGDKTILDALIPAVEVLEEGAAAGVALSLAFERAAQAAEAGASAAALLQSCVSRASWQASGASARKIPEQSCASCYGRRGQHTCKP